MMSAETKAAWLSARAGCLTGSNMWKAMDYLKNGNPSAARTQYLREVLGERLTGLNVRHFVTPAMERGLEFEDEMFDFFVERTGRTLRPSRLYVHPTIPNFCSTPDRELDDGLIEGKIPSTEKFIGFTLAGEIPDEYKPQMAAQCACSGKKWVGLIIYSPDIRDENKRLFMRRYEPTPEYIAEVEAAAVKFLDEAEELFSRFIHAPIAEPAPMTVAA